MLGTDQTNERARRRATASHPRIQSLPRALGTASAALGTPPAYGRSVISLPPAADRSFLVTKHPGEAQ
jgi:hypothetical protein